MGGMDFFFLEAHALIQNSPAHAGNTLDKNATVTIAQDHPRLRGEYTVGALLIPSSLGSPPLARGIHTNALLKDLCYGITPACAGNTNRRAKESGLPKDHPRLRGEYLLQGSLHGASLGSPPLARGIHPLVSIHTPTRGITPACAGNTLIK